MVRREGMKPFNFEEVHRDIGSGAIVGYLDASGWEILKGYGITPKHLASDLKTVMNVRAFDYSTSLATGTTLAMANEILIKVCVLILDLEQAFNPSKTQGLDHEGNKVHNRRNETAAAAGMDENDTLLVVDAEMGKVPEQTIQVVHQNVDEIEALKAEHAAFKVSVQAEHAAFKVSVQARFQAMEEQSKS
jgi:hypothetical protein